MAETAEQMRQRAQQLRRLANQERDLSLSATFKRIAEGFEHQARKLEAIREEPRGHA